VDADLILLLVNHSQFRMLKASVIALLTKARIVVDMVGTWDNVNWGAAGFKVYRLGDAKQRA
jgi:UDP-N-acetyl-D-mannosaminuronate dehydrogenase